MCSIRLRLPHSYVNNVYFDVNKGSAFFTGKQDLALYTISNVHYDSRSDKTNLAINFELCRRQGLVLMTTFIPSMLLLLVSWATLFIKQEALNVRAGMALTTLLILYTLFANFSRSIPQTDIVKLVDIWFFFIIMLLFLNIMMHIFTDYVTLMCYWDTAVAPQGHRPKNGTERLIRVYRLFVFPGIFALFNIIFWTMIIHY